MNQEKIGKLIAKLRKEQGLTQQQLGDKVNVGGRAVSKWERGINLPDIAIINQLSEILGITSDELLKGELNNPKTTSNKKKSNYKWLLLLIPIIALVIGIIMFLSNENSDDEVYLLKSLNKDEYYIDGKLILADNKMSIYINKIDFIDYNFNKIVIKNYEYYLTSQENIICGFGDNGVTSSLTESTTIKDFLKTFTVNYKIEKQDNIEKIINNDLILEFTFIDENDSQISKKIPIKIMHNNKWL